MRTANIEVRPQATAVATMTGPLPNASISGPPTATPRNRISVPLVVDTEFAISRSSAGTSFGTTAVAVVRRNRFAESTSSAPA